MKAILNGQVIAEANKEDLIYIERNWYFPPSNITEDLFRESDTPYTCPWKGDCQYFDVKDGDNWVADAAWSYPEPYPSAIQKVKKEFSGYIAFSPGVTVVE